MSDKFDGYVCCFDLREGGELHLHCRTVDAAVNILKAADEMDNASAQDRILEVMKAELTESGQNPDEALEVDSKSRIHRLAVQQSEEPREELRHRKVLQEASRKGAVLSCSQRAAAVAATWIDAGPEGISGVDTCKKLGLGGLGKIAGYLNRVTNNRLHTMFKLEKRKMKTEKGQYYRTHYIAKPGAERIFGMIENHVKAS